MDVEKMIKDALAGLLEHMGVPFRELSVTREDSKMDPAKKLYRIDIDSDESAILIGHHGENIYALQHVLKTIIWKKTDQNVFVIIDVDGYRKRQEENVIVLAQKKVDALRKTGASQSLPPMSPYFRRIVHLFLARQEYADVTTESVGEGDHRAVTIKYK